MKKSIVRIFICLILISVPAGIIACSDNSRNQKPKTVQHENQHENNKKVKDSNSNGLSGLVVGIILLSIVFIVLFVNIGNDPSFNGRGGGPTPQNPR